MKNKKEESRSNQISKDSKFLFFQFQIFYHALIICLFYNILSCKYLSANQLVIYLNSNSFKLNTILINHNIYHNIWYYIKAIGLKKNLIEQNILLYYS